MSSPSSTTTSLSERYRNANSFLQVVVTLVALYGLLMVVAGNGFAMPMFDSLGFGPKSKGLLESSRDDGDDIVMQYCLFMFGVLGAIIVGWMTVMWFVVQQLTIHPTDATIRRIARQALIVSTIVWFVLDTGFSIIISEMEHALFNIPFLSLLAIPLYIMSTSDDHHDSPSSSISNDDDDDDKKGQ